MLNKDEQLLSLVLSAAQSFPSRPTRRAPRKRSVRTCCLRSKWLVSLAPVIVLGGGRLDYCPCFAKKETEARSGRAGCLGHTASQGVDTGVMLKTLDFQISIHHPFRGWKRPWRKPAGSSAAEHKGLGLSPPLHVKAGASMLIKMSLPSSPCWAQSQLND